VPGIREAAVRKLTNQTLRAKIAIEDTDPNVRAAAGQKRIK